MSNPRGPSLHAVSDDEDAPVEGVDSSGFLPSGESEQTLLAAGKIDVEEFMEMSVDRALSHLKGQISEERLGLMREVLRSQLEQDPNLLALVDSLKKCD